jgi:23S rRNA (cytosine1962-C5)-methyltransferase
MTNEYELLDCGEGRRLESFQGIVIDRVAPQAKWPKKLSKEIWNTAQAKFIKTQGESLWELNPQCPENITLRLDDFLMKLRFSPQGQLGIYPEQNINWKWIIQQCKKKSKLKFPGNPLSRILNGFAYTGGSTLAALAGGKETLEMIHLDASKASINWTRDNLLLNHFDNLATSLVVEDMIKFMQREVNRGNRFNGLILDPPAFGRAKGGKTWKLQRDFPELMKLCTKLLHEENSFFVLSCHDPFYTKKDLKEMLSTIPAIKSKDIETLDLVIPSEKGNDLPNGITARWSSLK